MKTSKRSRAAWLAVFALATSACSMETTTDASASEEPSATSIDSTTSTTDPTETTDTVESDATDTDPRTADVELEGEPLPAMSANGPNADPTTDDAYGLVAPTVTGTDFEGNEITIEPDGRAKVIYFVAHWCPHCQNEVPLIQSLIDEGLQPNEIDIYAVSTAYRPEAAPDPRQWLLDEGFQPPTIRDSDSNEAFTAFAGNGFPYAVYLDSEHQVIGRTVGSVDRQAMLLWWETTASDGALTG